MAPTATWETVLERNTVERIKLDKPPLGIRDELPALIAGGYEALPEEDIVRLQWWGLYHDKPKVGTFMLRVKIPNGVLTPAKLRTIGELSNRYGRGDAELTTDDMNDGDPRFGREPRRSPMTRLINERRSCNP